MIDAVKPCVAELPKLETTSYILSGERSGDYGTNKRRTSAVWLAYLAEGVCSTALGASSYPFCSGLAPGLMPFTKPTSLSQMPDGSCSVTAERMLSKSGMGPDTLVCRRKELLDPKCRSASGIGCISCSSSGSEEKKVDDGGLVRGAG